MKYTILLNEYNHMYISASYNGVTFAPIHLLGNEITIYDVCSYLDKHYKSITLFALLIAHFGVTDIQLATNKPNITIIHLYCNEGFDNALQNDECFF